MLKKLLIPFFVISVAAVASNGCGSSGGTAGKGGAGGGTAGAGGGTAGAGTAGAGTAGAGTAGAGTAGAGTDAGTAGAGTDAGTAGATVDAGTAGADGGGADMSTDADVTASCTVSTDAPTTAVLSAEAFCANVVAECTATTAGMAVPATYTMSSCMATYGAKSAASMHCQSYHLCWGVEGKGAGPKDPTTHCAHAWGGGPCANL
ncbi:MAG TPA: hypothetical protein VH560_19255 [Polyangia bacterium]|nr:hypothetical protein [Polyangia bacterium]